MSTNKIDFHNAECSACCKKHVDVRTEIVAPPPDRPNAIRKKIIFRCEDHLDCDVDEIEKLALVKKRFQNLNENDLFDGETFLCSAQLTEKEVWGKIRVGKLVSMSIVIQSLNVIASSNSRCYNV